MTDETNSTKKATKMATTINVETMSFNELQKLIASANAAVEGKRKSELAAIAKTFTESLEAGGFTKAEGLAALGAGTRAKASGSKKSKATGPAPKWGQTYKDPASGAIWTKSPTGKGQVVRWLADAVAAGKKFEDFEA